MVYYKQVIRRLLRPYVKVVSIQGGSQNGKCFRHNDRQLYLRSYPW